MNTFPAEKKVWVLAHIMSLTPLKTEVRSDNNNYEKSLIQLRKDS